MYFRYSRPPYLSPFAKCLTDVVRHKDDHLCWCSVIFTYSTDKFTSCVVPGPSQLSFHLGEEFVIAWPQEKTTTLGATDRHQSSWQCKESHCCCCCCCCCCCHGPLAQLAMEDSGTSTVLTRYESMQFRYLRQSERTTARYPVQHRRWTYPCYRTVIRNINEDGSADGVRRLPNIW